MAPKKALFVHNSIASEEDDPDYTPEDIPYHESQIDNEQQTLQDPHKLNGWNLVTIEADASLQAFPLSLKSEIEDYLQSSDADIETIAATRADFKLHMTVNKKKTQFLEKDTTNVLDCALYRWDIPNESPLRIVVVKSRQGSSFNDRKPAVISCHAKAMSKDPQRQVVSRWKVWTLDQDKKDLTVERVVVKDNVNTTGHNLASALPRKRKSRVSSSDVGASLDASGLQSTEVDDTNSDLVDNGQTTTNTSKRNRVHASNGTTKSRSQSESQNATKDATRNSVLPIQRHPYSLLATNASSPGLLRDLPASARHTLQTMRPSVSARLSNGTPAPQSLNRVLSESVEIKQTQDKTAAPQTLFCFQADAGGNIRYKKDFTYCNTVQKMFAYARIARISKADTMILSASVGPYSVAIVQDDEEEFHELLELVEKTRRQQVGEHAAVEVTVTAFED